MGLMIVWFMVEVGKQSLNVRLGKHNIPSIVLGAIILGIYLKFLPYIFQKRSILVLYNTSIQLIRIILYKITKSKY